MSGLALRLAWLSLLIQTKSGSIDSGDVAEAVKMKMIGWRAGGSRIRPTPISRSAAQRSQHISRSCLV